MDLVRRLLTELKANPNSRNQADGGTALHQAAAYDSSGACTKVLIEYGADTEAESRAGWTPLFSAVYFSQAASVAVLLKAGANVEHRVRGFDSSASSVCLLGLYGTCHSLFLFITFAVTVLPLTAPSPHSFQFLHPPSYRLPTYPDYTVGTAPARPCIHTFLSRGWQDGLRHGCHAPSRTSRVRQGTAPTQHTMGENT